MHPPFMVPYMRQVIPYQFKEFAIKQHGLTGMVDRRINRFLSNPHAVGVLSNALNVPYQAIHDARYSNRALAKEYYYLKGIIHPYPYPYISSQVYNTTQRYVSSHMAIFVTVTETIRRRIPIIVGSVLPRNAPALLRFAREYRLCRTDAAYLIGTFKWLRGTNRFLQTAPYEFTPHKLALLSSLRCTSGDIMGLMNTDISDDKFVKAGHPVDLFLRLTLAPYEHHHLMFNLTNHMPLEDMYDYLPVRGRGGSKTGNDPYYKFDEIASYRENLYPLYEELAIGEYVFPEGRHRSLIELASDPDWYKALESDGVTVVDIAHLFGVSVPVFMQICCNFLLDIRQKSLGSRNPFVTEYQHGIEAFYQRVTRSSNKVSHRNILFSEMVRLHEYVKPIYSFLELYIAKVGALEMEIIDRLGNIDILNFDTEIYLEKTLFPDTGIGRKFKDM